MKKRNGKTRWLVFILIVLIVAIAVFCIVLPTKNKIKAPQSENKSGSTATDTQNIKGATTTDNFEYKDQNGNQATAPVDSNPSSTDPYYFYDLGNSKLATKDYQSAIVYYDKALALNQLDSKFYVKKSEALVSLGKKSDAIDTVNQGLAKLPNNESLLTQLDILKNVVK